MKEQKNHYRIYFVNDKGKQITVRRFDAKNDNSAFRILSKYKKDNINDGVEYYYGTAGNYIGPDKKAYDTPEELHEAYKKSKYTLSDRKMDIEDIERFVKDCEKDEYNKVIDKIDKLIVKHDDSILQYDQDITVLLDKIKRCDLNKCSEKQIDEIKSKIDKINDKKYKFDDMFYLLKNKHNTNESWDITHHILTDILYNIPILIKTKHGIPCYFLSKVVKDVSSDYTKEEWKKAEEIYNNELKKLVLYIRLYYFYSDYGIVDEKDKEMKKIYDEYKNTIPYEKGTYKQIDYKKLTELQMKYSNLIWDWMKEYGQMIWD